MIADYSELIAEVSEMTGVSDVATRAKRYVDFAEKAMSKRLRMSEMEAEATATTVDGKVDLPDDFVEMRQVRVNNCELYHSTILSVRNDEVYGYAIQGKQIVSTKKNHDHELLYYATVPSLAASETGTTWLLEAEPELYMHAVAFQVYTFKGMLEQAQMTAGYIAGLIGEANENARKARFTGTSISLAGAGS